MKIVAVNGSPRKNKNTATILGKIIEGAKSVCPDAEVELVHLYDLKFTGCRSCFACKLNDEKHLGVRCFWKDELTPVLDSISDCDALILGTPIYLFNYTGEFYSFLERLLFSYSTYDLDFRTTAPKKMPTALVYTMNWTEEQNNEILGDRFAITESIIGNVFTPPEKLLVCDTYQFDDYSKYSCEKFNEADKRRQREEHWPIDLENAFNVGVRLMQRRLDQLENEK
ncbi:MAG: flavodoxin family protein [Oscillospiraceae bacterium]|nr:flavodoxin family protein [Oscillospiraceae bacterium]